MKFYCHSGARAISAFARVFDARWRVNPEPRYEISTCFWIPGPRASLASRNDAEVNA